MRNIVVSRDLIALVPENLVEGLSYVIVSITVDVTNDELYALTNNGHVICISQIETLSVKKKLYKLLGVNAVGSDDSLWFSISNVGEIGSIVCISHSGSIESIPLDRLDNGSFDENNQFESLIEISEQVGVVDGGIAAASWSPDQSLVIILTRNNTLMYMLNSWEDVEEIPFPPFMEDSKAIISWCGDGEIFAIVTTDVEDKIPKARIYSKKLEFLYTGRSFNAPGILRGLSSSLSFAPAGNLITCGMKKTKNKLQVLILERNGYYHGEFDIHTPSVSSIATNEEWDIISLHWDVSSTVLAVTLQPVNSDISIGVIQLYTRNNYHWYCKQQWTEPKLVCLGWDTEKWDRLYCTHSTSTGKDSMTCVRVIDIVWDVVGTSTSDCTVGVIDGCKLLLTPLGRSVIPPPMSRVQAVAPNVINNAYFWPVAMDERTVDTNSTVAASTVQTTSDKTEQQSFSPGNSSVNSLVTAAADSSVAYSWGCICLCDHNQLFLLFGGGTSTGSGKTGPSTSTRTSNLYYTSLGVAIPLPINIATDVDAKDNILKAALDGFVIRRVAANIINTITTTVSTEDTGLLILLCGTRIATGVDEILVIHRDGGTQQLSLIETVPVGGRFSSVHPGTSTSSSTCSFVYAFVSHGDTLQCYELNVTASSTSSTVDISKNDVDFRVDIIPTVCGTPEICSHITVLPSTSRGVADVGCVGELTSDQSGIGFNNDSISLGLTAKGRLYCGETLLGTNINSYCVNVPMDMVLCVTAGVKPVLRFFVLSRLRYIDGLHSEDASSNPWEVDEPRPIERGARLVSVVAGGTLVIIQLPRGNLEAFEPRPLLLQAARVLLDSNRYLDCLLLLRRQRIDLNLLVDHSLSAFLRAVPDFVTQTLKHDPEFLSLFISALTTDDVTLKKYPNKIKRIVLSDTNMTTTLITSLQIGNKVNIVCDALRETLSNIVYNNTDNDSRERAIKPLLCSLARQQPPLLAEALEVVKLQQQSGGPNISIISGIDPAATATVVSSVASSWVQSSPKCQMYLKYLSFLVDASVLFDAALASCDFDAAKAIASGAQMDPRQYLPLIKSLKGDDIDNESNIPLQENLSFAMMNYRVSLHLKRNQEVIRWGLIIFELNEKSNNDNNHDDNDDEVVGTLVGTSNTGMKSSRNNSASAGIQDSFMEVVTSQALFEYTLPRLRSLVIDLSKNLLIKNLLPNKKKMESKNIPTIVLNTLQFSYAKYCEKSSRYKDAVHAYILCQPVEVKAAIHAALKLGDWSLALTVATVHQPSQDRNSGISTSNVPDTSIKDLAREIVEQYRVSLEQAQGCSGDRFGDPEDGGDITSTSGENAVAGRTLEAARLCELYLNDVEAAVEILLLGQRWKEALLVTGRHGRRDLMMEVVDTCRAAAVDAGKAVTARQALLLELVGEMRLLWADSEGRLQQVATTEGGLQRQLRVQYDGDDTRSELSGMTGHTYASVQSVQSSQSKSSNTSSASSLWGGSQASQASQFSIGGIEHSLLSRGDSINRGPGAVSEQKRRKKKERRSKGSGKDVWGTKREGDVCSELWVLSNIGTVATAVGELCEALVLINGNRYMTIAADLQTIMNSFIDCLIANVPPGAPNYPADWLEAKEMPYVKRFQKKSTSNGTESCTTTGVDVTDWQMAVKSGVDIWINKWRTASLASYRAKDLLGNAEQLF